MSAERMPPARDPSDLDPELVRAAAELRATVATNVRALARRRGMSLNRLVDFAGVTRSAFYRAMGGKATMTLDTLAKLAVGLEVGVARLVRPE